MIYEYVCDKCKLIYEKKHSMKDSPEFFCDKCKKKLRRLITGGVGFILKGAGFYRVDYKKSKEYNQPMTKKEREKKGLSW